MLIAQLARAPLGELAPPTESIPWLWPVLGAVLFVVSVVAIVVLAYERWKAAQAKDVRHLIGEDWTGDGSREHPGRRAELAQLVRATVQESFTGRAEADAHFRAEALSSYKTELSRELSAHETRERAYVDSLRQLITENTVKVELALADAKRLAVHVSAEYRDLSSRLAAVEGELRAVKAQLEDLRRAGA
jgi:hypothetical protein